MSKIDTVLAYFPSVTTMIIGLYVFVKIANMDKSETTITWVLLSAILCLIGVMWFYLTLEIRQHGIKDNTPREK